MYGAVVEHFECDERWASRVACHDVSEPKRSKCSSLKPGRLKWHNRSAFNGQPGAEPRWIHQDRSARPVHCSAGLSVALEPPEHPIVGLVDGHRLPALVCQAVEGLLIVGDV